jgi:arylsulfatase B
MNTKPDHALVLPDVFKYCSPTRSSLMSGRVPPHVNQNNLCNDIQSTSGVDLRYTLLPEKMKLAGCECRRSLNYHL